MANNHADTMEKTSDSAQVSKQQSESNSRTAADKQCDPLPISADSCPNTDINANKDTILSEAIKSLHVTVNDDTDMKDSQPYNNTRSRSKESRNVTFQSGSVKIDLNKGEAFNSDNDKPATNEQVHVIDPLTKTPPPNGNKKAHKFSFLNFPQEEETPDTDEELMDVEEPVKHALADKQVAKKSKGKKDYEVLDAALPAWKSATSHRSAEQKASLRYYHYKSQLEDNSYPSWAYGFERLPPYFCPPTEEMLKIVKQHAKEMTQQACIELAALSVKEKKLADKHMQVTQVTYETWKNADYLKAEARHVEVITGYRAGEEKKLRAYKERDDSKKPSDDETLGAMLTNRVSRDPDILKKVEIEMQLLSLDDPDNVNYNNDGQDRKRKKPRSRGNTPTRQDSPEPSTSRASSNPTQSNRERSRERRGPGSNRGRGRSNRGRGYGSGDRGRGGRNHYQSRQYDDQQYDQHYDQYRNPQYRDDSRRGRDFRQSRGNSNRGRDYGPSNRGRDYGPSNQYSNRGQRGRGGFKDDRAMLKYLCNKIL
jgi:hypothetical protein